MSVVYGTPAPHLAMLGIGTEPHGVVERLEIERHSCIVSLRVNEERRVHRDRLSKLKIAMFEQCAKRVWLSTHRPELAQQIESAEARSAAGEEVRALARTLLPNGTFAAVTSDIDAAVEMTCALVDAKHKGPIFDATLLHDGVLVRFDILEPDDAGGWRIAEVKSSTSAKDYHVGELATQVWVARQVGFAVSAAVIRHLNNGFVLTHQGESSGLFADTDMLAAAENLIAERPKMVAAARETLAGPEPQLAPGSQCEKPFPCDFASYCHSAVPKGPEWPVTILPNGGGRRWASIGVYDLLAVDPRQLNNPLHSRVWHATSSGAPYHDPAGARAAMADWDYPRTWLDFETISFAVPRWIGTRPYQQVPFQFSAHVEQADGHIDHHEYLAISPGDPRRACAEALLKATPPNGAVIGYNASFERSRLIELADAYPDLEQRLRAVAHRIVDLLPVTRAHWYHRDQRGSWSIKSVLPTIAAELSYDGLEVKDGAAAQMAYLEAIAPDTSLSRAHALAVGLKRYCAQDTRAMIIIAQRLCSMPETA